MRKEPIKLGGEPWRQGSSKPTAKEPIKMNEVSWNATQKEESKRVAPKMEKTSWSQTQKEETKRTAPKMEMSQWTAIQIDKVKRTAPKMEMTQWGTTQPKEKKEIPELKAVTWGEVQKEQTSKVAPKVEAGSWGEIPEKATTGGIKIPEPVKTEPNQWHEIVGLQEPQVIRQFDGINELSAFSIKDSHATRNKNVTTSSYPAMSVRKGSTKVTGFAGLTSVLGLGVRNSELHVIEGGKWYRYLAGVWTTLKTGLNVNAKATFVNFQGSFAANNLIMTNGIDAAMKYDGTSVTNLANAPALSDFVCTHDNRVYLASGSTIYFSALRKAEDWNTVNEAGQIVVETSDGKSITGLVAGSQRLTVFKQNSIHELFGTNPGNFTMKLVTDNLGTPTGNTAQVIDGVIYFLGNDGVYRYSGGSLPTSEFSIPIRESIKNINAAYANKSVSWQVGKKYYLAIPTGSNTEAETVLEYDTEFQTWNTWSYPNKVTAKGVTLDGVPYIGLSLGLIYKLDGANAKDDTTSISWEWVSKPFTFSSLASRSRWYRMWVGIDLPTGSTMNIHLSGQEDGESWTLVKTVTPNANAQAMEIMIPVNLIFESNWARIRLEGTGPATVYEVSRQERIFPFGQT